MSAAHPDPIDAVMYDAMEFTYWQNLADALNNLTAYSIDVVAALCDQHGVKEDRVIDYGEEPATYMLRYIPPYTPDPEDVTRTLPFGWQVAPRTPDHP